MDYSEPLKIAFIGGGLNSAVGYAHYCASHLDGNFELVAGAFSQQEEINKKTAQKYGVKPQHTYDCWQNLILSEKDHIDAIVILTPTPLHEKMVIYAIENGIPVICEKALTNSLAAFKNIENAVKENNGYLAVTYNYSGYPMVRELKNRIEKDELGKIHHIQIEMPQEGFSRLLDNGSKPCPQKWRLEDGEIPTIHLDLTVHLQHLVYYLTGKKPLNVSAEHNSFGWFEGIIDDASATAEYQDNLKCRYWVSKSSLGHKNGLKISLYGDKGSAFWYQADSEYLKLSYVDGKQEIIERGGICTVGNEPTYNRFKPGHPSGFIEAFANIYTDFAASIVNFKQGTKDHVSKEYGLEPTKQSFLMLDAMVKSAKSKYYEQISYDE